MLWLFALFIILWILSYYTIRIAWTTAILALLPGAYTATHGLTQGSTSLWIGFLLFFIPLNIHFIRKQLFSRWIFKLRR